MSSPAQKNSQRLNTQRVSLVMEKGRAIPSFSFLVKFIKTTDKSLFAYSPIAPKKIFKTAVLRNKAKRRARAAMQAVCRTKKIATGIQLTLVLRQPALTIDIQELKKELEQVLQKHDIISTL